MYNLWVKNRMISVKNGVVTMEILYSFNGSVNSDLESVKTFLKNILEKLGTYIKDEEMFFDIRLILNELIVNGVIHGNKKNSDKKVFVNMTIDENNITINVRDEGEGIDYDFTSYNVDEMRCCGRGLVLVDALTDDLILKKNEIIAIKYL